MSPSEEALGARDGARAVRSTRDCVAVRGSKPLHDAWLLRGHRVFTIPSRAQLAVRVGAPSENQPRVGHHEGMLRPKGDGTDPVWPQLHGRRQARGAIAGSAPHPQCATGGGLRPMPRARPSSQHHLLATYDGGSHEQQRVRRSPRRDEVAGPALQAAPRSDEGLQAANCGVAPGRRQLDGQELGPVAKVEAEGHPVARTERRRRERASARSERRPHEHTRGLSKRHLQGTKSREQRCRMRLMTLTSLPPKLKIVNPNSPNEFEGGCGTAIRPSRWALRHSKRRFHCTDGAGRQPQERWERPPRQRSGQIQGA